MGRTLIFKPVENHTRVYEPATKCRKSIRIIRRSIRLSMGGRMRQRRGAIIPTTCEKSIKVKINFSFLFIIFFKRDQLDGAPIPFYKLIDDEFHNRSETSVSEDTEEISVGFQIVKFDSTDEGDLQEEEDTDGSSDGGMKYFAKNLTFNRYRR